MFHDTPPAEADHSFSSAQIQQSISTVSGEGANDYAILDLPDLLEHHPYQFTFAEHGPQLGQSVAFLGYARDHWCLTCHAGVISSIYPSGAATMLQLEANIDPSSAGGPLFNSSGEVLGIITHGMPPLVNAFDNLFQSFDRTIATLSGARFFAAPSQAIIAIQQDMKEVARQLQRYATPGVGFAIACDTIKTESIWSGGIDDGGQPIQT